MDTMSSKERVMSALNHVQPDRVASDYFGTPEIESALMEHFGVKSHDAILDRLRTDLRKVTPEFVGPERKRFSGGSVEDIWGVVRSPMANEYGEYNEPTYLPFAEVTTLEQVEAYPWPSPDWYDYSTLKDQCGQRDGFAVCTGGFGVMDLINGIAFGRGVERVILDIGAEDPVGMALMDHRAKFWLAYAERALDAADGMIDILCMGDDYGTQNGLLLHPDKWRKLFKPRMKAMIDLAHGYGAKVIHHSCGSTREIIEDFIEIGLDCLQTIQPQAWGMNPSELKGLFGDRISFHGAVDVQGELQRSTPDQVRAMVLDRIRVVGRDGGYICAPSHNIQPDTPLENVLVMYDAIQHSVGHR